MNTIEEHKLKQCQYHEARLNNGSRRSDHEWLGMTAESWKIGYNDTHRKFLRQDSHVQNTCNE